MVGVRKRSCLASCNWADEEPLCERLPDKLQYGSVTGAEDNIYGYLVQFACELDGPERLTCKDHENWNGIMLNCRPVEYPNLGLVANIVVGLKQADPQLNPSRICDGHRPAAWRPSSLRLQYYKLVGSSCQADGDRSNGMPQGNVI